ncbi:hypothetical protein GCM10010515_33740 [Streptomyces fructofermentans]|uniref:Uncharacterized protein n=1 Tax=Streptomyces fructofermentans TaxID=152141 RepID=A0A918KHB7_9ACTN|nr:hypothetical protein GCM10010515_33740 [Streptomyces fructofermentans]
MRSPDRVPQRAPRRAKRADTGAAAAGAEPIGEDGEEGEEGENTAALRFVVGRAGAETVGSAGLAAGGAQRSRRPPEVTRTPAVPVPFGMCRTAVLGGTFPVGVVPRAGPA